MNALKKKGSNMLTSNKFIVAMSVVALSSIGGGLMSTVHADEVKQDTNVVQTAAVDTTSENAIAEKAKLVILGVDTDGTIIPHGEERIAYLKAQNYDYQKVQDKVNELLAAAVQAPVAQAPAQAPVAQAPVAQAPVAQAPAAQAPVAQAPAAQAASTGNYTTRNGFAVGSAKEAVAMTESGGSYSASNGQYVGRYQLSASYLNGDYSPENQERVADNYVAQRYGSWEAAWAFHQAHGWY